MRTLIIRLAALSLLIALPKLIPSAPSTEILRWYKGNLHAHTLNSDGDSMPGEVVAWYREHNYQFLVLSDHNYLTDVSELSRIYRAHEKFILISGEEVTDKLDRKQIHLNAYGISNIIQPQGGTTVAEVIQRNVNAIRKGGGIPSANHPNYTWAISASDLMQVTDLGLFEVFNGSWSVGNYGGGGHASHEEIWDTLLSADRLIYGVAVDDAHDFKAYGKALPYPPTIPGTGWIVVRAPELTSENILSAVQRGDFYSSTGVILDDIIPGKSSMSLRIKQVRDNQYTTYFIGKNGTILEKSTELAPAYHFKGGELYVRARVQESSGAIAWTQPIFPRR